MSRWPLSPRQVLGLLALFSLVGAWLSMTHLSRQAPWYDHAEMNVHNMADALAINAAMAPGRVDQPGLPAKYLLSLDYRVRHYLGALPVWNLKKFGDQPDPLREIPRLLHIGRVHSQALVILFILTAAGLIHAVTRNAESALLATVLLSGSSGLLFHGLITRPDVLCVWFGTVLAPFFAWRASTAATLTARHAWLFLAGLGAGLAILAKLPALYYLAAGYVWCWVSAVTGPGLTGPVRLPSFLLPIASSAAIFWLMTQLVVVPAGLTPVAVERLRLAAAIVGLLPLLALDIDRSRPGAFLSQRSLELALLGGGALSAIVLSYGALAAVMSPAPATEYLARVLQFVVHPDPQLKYLLAATPAVGREFVAFVRESPFLFAGTGAVTVIVALTRETPVQLKAFITLLGAHAIVMTWLLSHRYFLDQFSVFAQVPLLLVWVLGLFALGLWQKGEPPAGVHWAVPAVITSAAVLVATAFLRLEPKQRSARTETAPPVSPLTLTYLYDDQNHPQRYQQIMQQRYPDREKFTAALERFLTDPAQR